MIDCAALRCVARVAVSSDNRNFGHGAAWRSRHANAHMGSSDDNYIKDRSFCRSVGRSVGRSLARSLSWLVYWPLAQSRGRSLGRSLARSLARLVVLLASRLGGKPEGSIGEATGATDLILDGTERNLTRRGIPSTGKNARRRKTTNEDR